MVHHNNNNNNQASTTTNEIVWTPELMLEVQLNTPDDFLRVAETLTRIGISGKDKKILYQSAHILHKKGRYYIVHFKEMFALDGKSFTISETDLARRNTIAILLEDWGLLTIMSETDNMKTVPINTIKILTFKEKEEWELVPKYRIGNVKKRKGVK